MEVRIKNIHLAATAENFSALLREKISFGTKNRIQKIIKEIGVHYTPFHALWVEMIKAHGGKEKEGGRVELPDPENPPEDFTKEFKELSEDTAPLMVDLIDYSKLDSVESEHVYNYDLLEPFFEKQYDSN